jgi:cell division protein FtsW (lipid II flippase)
MDQTIEENKSTFESSELLSLREFIELNHNLLSALGIFMALTVFAANIPYEFLRTGLSFVFLAVSVILWIETFFNYNPTLSRRKYSLLMRWFNVLMEIATFLLILYWLVAYSIVWKIMLPVVIFAILIALSSLILDRLSYFKKLHYPIDSKHKLKKQFLWWVLFFASLFLCLYVAIIISPTLYKFIDDLSKQIPLVKFK